MVCPRCATYNARPTTFCESCGKVINRARLEGVRLMGPIGVQHSTSPRIEEFFRTGNPDALSERPPARPAQ
jgi:hypothetical protein